MSDPSSVESIFFAALKIESPGERTAYLDQACGGNAELRREIELLLTAHPLIGQFLERPAVPPAGGTGPFTPSSAPAPALAVGSVVAGRYKLRERLGEGGMGVVYVADQTHPVQRRVALKLIKAGLDSAVALARFEQERQALALMDHPHIAKVLDAGTTDAGQPFFVMELVKGIPITTYCDQEKLSPKERLELFVPVCQAVQHAHQKGVIHRDLKPSNILIGLYDGKPVPKVIDFGVAKTVGPRLTEHSVYTEAGMMVGTLEYMAPEQAELNNLDIDTRADVYALGVVLYELLTGSVPFPRKQLQAAGLAEMLRVIKEVEPPKPSTRLSSSGDLPSLAAVRKLEPKRLTRMMRGDLDWIAMKCLEKERSRRYESANGLALDLQHYLADEPVLAGPPGASYRLRKFARKYKRAVGTAMAFAALMAAGVVVSTGLAVRATIAENQARTAEQRATEQRDQAETERSIAQAVNNFLQNDLLEQASAESQANPTTLPDRDLKVRVALERAAQKIGGRFQNQPLVEAAIRLTIGNTYRGLGEYSAAQPHLEIALALRRRILSEDHSDTLTAMYDLADLYSRQGKNAQAKPLYSQVVEVRRRKLGVEHPETLLATGRLALANASPGRYEQAIALLTEAAETARRVHGEEHPVTLSLMHSLGGNTSGFEGNYSKAEAILAKVLELRRRVLGHEHPGTLATMNSLAVIYNLQEKFTEAEALFTEALEISRRALGDDHPSTLYPMRGLAAVSLLQGKFARAEALFAKALEGRRRALGEDHPNTRSSQDDLGCVYQAQGRYAEAESLLANALAFRRRVLGEDNRVTAFSMGHLASLYHAQGKYTEAEPLYTKALASYRREGMEDNPYYALPVMSDLARLYRDRGEYGRAESLFLQFLESCRRKLGQDHPRVATALAELGLTLLNQKRFADAEPLLRECLAIREKRLPNDWRRFDAQSLLGGSLAGRQKYAEAEPLLVSGYEGMKAREAMIPAPLKKYLDEAGERVVQLYEATGQPDKAAKWRKELEAVRKSQPKRDAP